MEQINREMRLIEAKRHIQYNNTRARRNAINLIINYELVEFIPELKKWIKTNDKDLFSFCINALIALEGKKSIKFLIGRLFEDTYTEYQKKEIIFRISDFMIEGKQYYDSLKEVFHKIEKNLQISVLVAMKRIEAKKTKKFLSVLIQSSSEFKKPDFVILLAELERGEGKGTNAFLELAKNKQVEKNYVSNFLSLCNRYDLQNLIIEIQKYYPKEVEESDYFFSNIVDKSKHDNSIIINDIFLADVYLKKSYQELIAEKENDQIEFKASLKWELDGTINKDLEFKCIKVITSFLNTNGGILFLGVNDDRKIVGIESDLKWLPKNKQNYDTYELKIAEAIRKYSYITIRKLIKIDFVEINSKAICVILVPGKSQRPIFIRKSSKKYLPVRLGNQSSLIDDIEEALDYIDENWKKEPQFYNPFIIPPKT